MSLQPERLAEGWRLRGAAKREDLDWRGAEREECVCVCVDVLNHLTDGVCVTDKKGDAWILRCTAGCVWELTSTQR